MNYWCSGGLVKDLKGSYYAMDQIRYYRPITLHLTMDDKPWYLKDGVVSAPDPSEDVSDYIEVSLRDEGRYFPLYLKKDVDGTYYYYNDYVIPGRYQVIINYNDEDIDTYYNVDVWDHLSQELENPLKKAIGEKMNMVKLPLLTALRLFMQMVKRHQPKISK